MTVRGISHITFIVRDLDRAACFFCEGLGAKAVYDSAAQTFSLSPEKFFVLGGVWIAVMQGDPPAERSYRHTAFAVDVDDLADYANALSASAPRSVPRVRA